MKSDSLHLESLPAVFSWDDVAVGHGGIDHWQPVIEQTLHELLDTRPLAASWTHDRPYWFETRQESPRVFSGHTVLAEPFKNEYAVGCNTARVYGGRLTAYEYRAEKFIAAEPTETRVSRSADSIVEPYIKRLQP